MKSHNETDHESTKTTRPGYWLRAIEFRKHQLGREYRSTLGDKAREGISDEDYATTMATLEKMAVNLGWNESQAGEFGHPGFGPGRGFGPGFGRGHRRGPHRHGDDRHKNHSPSTNPEA